MVVDRGSSIYYCRVMTNTESNLIEIVRSLNDLHADLDAADREPDSLVEPNYEGMAIPEIHADLDAYQRECWEAQAEEDYFRSLHY